MVSYGLRSVGDIVAHSLTEWFTDIQRFDLRENFAVAAHQVRKAMKDHSAIICGHGAPTAFLPGASRRTNGCVDIFHFSACDGSQSLTGSRIECRERLSGFRGDPVAAHEYWQRVRSEKFFHFGSNRFFFEPV